MSKSPAALRRSVEDRIRKLVCLAQGRTHDRIRTILVMERFMVRIMAVFPEGTLLKGGLALELRLSQARTTKDIDLRAVGNTENLEILLEKIAAYRPEPEDHLAFVITPHKKHPQIKGATIRYDGFRYQVDCFLAEKRYTSFGLDISYGDPIFGSSITMEGSDFWRSYGIERASISVIPSATHLAEKLHAYSFPYEDRVNMRTKDLIDILLLAAVLDGVRAEELFQAFQTTFDFRQTHTLPRKLESPPIEWKQQYEKIRRKERLKWSDIDEVYQKASVFLNHVLREKQGVWSYEAFAWKEVE